MRILLKLSGEALAGPSKTGFDEPTVRMVAKQIAEIVSKGTQVGVVIGGGNFWRGRSSENIDRTKADQIGMLATVMNALYVSEICRSVGLKTDILTSQQIPASCLELLRLRQTRYSLLNPSTEYIRQIPPRILLPQDMIQSA